MILEEDRTTIRITHCVPTLAQQMGIGCGKGTYVEGRQIGGRGQESISRGRIDLRQCPAGIEITEAVIVDEIPGIHELIPLAVAVVTTRIFICNLGRTHLSLLGGNEDDTVVGPRTIDRSGRRVLQEFNAGNILCRYIIEGPDDPVNHHQGSAGTVDGCTSTQDDQRSGTRTAGGIDHLKSRNGTLQRGTDVGPGCGSQHLGIEFGDGTGHISA